MRGRRDEIRDLPDDDRLALVTISDGDGVRSVDFRLVWDPALLNVSAISLDASMPAGWTVTSNLTTPGLAIVSVSGPQPGLTSGAKTLLRLTASVPATAPYLAAHAMRVENFVFNAATAGLVGDVALHKVAYLGDVTGNGTYGALDPSRISRVAVELDSGFDPLGATDPLIVADVDGDGVIRGFDAVLVADKIAGFSVPEIPDLPGIVVPPPVTGPDPVVSLGSISLSPGVNGTVSASIDAPAGLQGFVFTIGFDPVRLDLVSAALGSVLPSGWSYSFNPDEQPGRAKVVAFAPDPIAAGAAGGQLLSLNVQALPSAAPGQTPLDLEGSLNDGELVLTAVDGSVTIAGGLPAWLAPGSSATWNALTKTLILTGAATIVADPGADLPVVLADGATRVLTINPASGSAIHLGALHLSNGATAVVTSVGPLRSATNHRVLVIDGGIADLSIDGSSSLDLADNDLVLDYDEGEPVYDVQTLLSTGYNFGGHDGPGIVSTAALNTDPFTFGLAYADNAMLPLPYGSVFGGQPFAGVDVDDTCVLIKFTWVGDVTLDGVFDFQDLSIFNGNYDSGASMGRLWSDGDLTFDGLMDFQDLSLFNGNYDPNKSPL